MCFLSSISSGMEWKKVPPIPFFFIPTFPFCLLAFSMWFSSKHHLLSIVFLSYFHAIFLTNISIPWRNLFKMHVVWQLIDLLTWFFHAKKPRRRHGKCPPEDSSGHDCSNSMTVIYNWVWVVSYLQSKSKPWTEKTTFVMSGVHVDGPFALSLKTIWNIQTVFRPFSRKLMLWIRSENGMKM